MASLNEVRSTFLSYFKKNGHEVVASSPLVPRNDPTLLFTNAGMVQFKNVFTGVEPRDYKRAVTSQKCVRAGGKHNDLDNVGYTARHHTFFEMLGNFSFGDYFKSDAIPFAWELLTKEFGLPAEKMLVTIYHDDDDAATIWKNVTGFSDNKIIRIASSDNFWSMGPTGPCGPCSEIFYDHGPDIPGGPPGGPNEDGDRFIEIWNLVFMQFEQFADGTRQLLPKPSIDTGMGLERVGAILQGKHDNYDTDLMRSLIEAAAHMSSVDPDGNGKFHCRVIADHLRSTAFLIADGVMPSNEGRGYVLRRIMRRAMRHAHLLGVEDPLMWRLAPALVAQMGPAFPELVRAQALVAETLRLEETRFRKTLDRGLKLLDDALDGLPDDAALPGETAFKLYDTYGFPLDLTQDALREKQRAVDIEGFDAAMAAQKARARAVRAVDAGEDLTTWFDLEEKYGVTEFLGYETLQAEGHVLAIFTDGEAVVSARVGDSVAIVVNQTPFYADSGGQQGDHGVMVVNGGAVEIQDTQKRATGIFAHIGVVKSGAVSVGDAVQMQVNAVRRDRLAANHTATHLIHEALRGALGDHVAQKGSLVAADRLRFDFTHSGAMSPEQIAHVEREANHYIRQNDAVTTRIMTPDEAEQAGARALFGEKYGDEVRVVSVGSRPAGDVGPAGDIYAMELCGGTHVKRTGEIGLVKVLGESASSAGVRRLEALTGAEALRYLETQDRCAKAAAAALKTTPDAVNTRIGQLLDERKKLMAEVAALRMRAAMAGGDAATQDAVSINGVTFFGRTLDGVSPKDLRGLIDAEKKRLGSAVITLIATGDEKAAVAVGVTDDLTNKISAVDLVKRAAGALGGTGGGGRPDMAQAGGAHPEKADEALAVIAEALKNVSRG